MAADSRKVAPGEAFFALAGAKDDGLKHVAQAVARGARAIVAERRPEGLGEAVFVAVADARAALARAASRFYPANGRRPSSPSPAPAARPRSRPSCARSGRASAMEAASLGTIGVVSRPVARLWLADDARPRRVAPDARAARRGRRHAPRDGGLLARARPEAARRRDAWPPPPSPICRATTWIITRRRRIISPPSCGCSANLLPPGAARRDRRRQRHRAARRSRPCARRAGRLFTVGAKGEAIRLVKAHARGLRDAADASPRRPSL